MTLQHIIVEGPDGAGKTTFIKTLRQYLGDFTVDGEPPLHPRFSHSLRGPDLGNLANLVTDDTYRMPRTPRMVYDRHPLISEYIYGPLCRGGVPDVFRVNSWRTNMTEIVAASAVVVLCLPPVANVMKAVLQPGDGQMPGVIDNIGKIWHAYDRLTWPGVMLHYDYTAHPLSVIHTAIRRLTNDND